MKALAADDPRVIGEYRLRARLGAGGMGRVYLGLSPGGRAVAVKVVHPDLATDTEFLRRFGQEVAAARAVSGIYTAPVVASGLHERPPWLATAFVPGPPLEHVVTEHGPLPEEALWPLLAGLVEALQAIHACGVVHRDLKPANVLLAPDGPRVIDFGISRAADGTMLTAAGMVFGTPGFMSPEQAEGKPAGPASDMFALGCVIGYAATGICPFGTGTAAAVLYRVVHSAPALDAGRGLPPRLREIVASCLAKDPGARPTPQEVAAAIAGRPDATLSSMVAFWPRQVAGVIGAYQARMEHEAKGGQGQAAAPSSVQYARTIPSDPGVLGSRRAPTGVGAPGASEYAGTPGGSGYGGAPGAGGGSGYGGGVSGPPAPRGYLPAGAGAPVGSAGTAVASGYQGAVPGSGPGRYREAAPASVLNAVRMMRLGAAFTVIYGIVFAVTVSTYAKHHPLVSARDHLSALVTWMVFATLVEAGLWLGVARACGRGRNPARITGTVLFGCYTLGTLRVLTDSHQWLASAKPLSAVGWVIACVAVVFLWQRPSGRFFRNSR